MSERHRITKAAGLISIATFISRVLGYVRDMVLAFFFGATGLSDTFFIAFRIPNLLRELFAEGSLTSALIPVLVEYQRKDEEEARVLVRVLLAFILIVVGSITGLGIVFAPQIVTIMAPGFLNNPEKFSQTVLLTRIMFPFLLFISLAALAMGALNVRRVFFVPALAPAILNVVNIATIIALSRTITPIISVAIGVVVGGLAQFGFQLPSMLREGYSLRAKVDFSHPGLRKIGSLVAPATLGMAVNQINILVSSIIASFLTAGSITYLFYSMHLIQFPVGIFGVAMGTAVIPSLSEHALSGQEERLREDYSFALRLLFFMTLPAMAGLLALREPIVSTLFQRGRFDYTATLGTSNALLFYSLGIWAMVGARLSASAFYSMQNTKTPVRVAVVALIANIILSLSLVGPLSYMGLALANALASTVNFSLLIYSLRKRLGRIEGRAIIKSFIKTATASLLMALAGVLILRGGPWQVQGESLHKALRLFQGIGVSIGVYFFFCYIFRSEEFFFVLDIIKKRFKR